MAAQEKVIVPPIRVQIVDNDGRPTRDMAEFMLGLLVKIKALEARVKELEA